MKSDVHVHKQRSMLPTVAMIILFADTVIATPSATIKENKQQTRVEDEQSAQNHQNEYYVQTITLSRR